MKLICSYRFFLVCLFRDSPSGHLHQTINISESISLTFTQYLIRLFFDLIQLETKSPLRFPKVLHASEAGISKALGTYMFFDQNIMMGLRFRQSFEGSAPKDTKGSLFIFPLYKNIKKNTIIMDVMQNQNWWVSWMTLKTSEPICILPSVSSEKVHLSFIRFHPALRNLAEDEHDYFLKQEANCPISRRFKSPCSAMVRRW